MFHQKKQRPKARSRKCLIQFEVSESLVKNDIYVDTKLFLEASERKEKGQIEFAAFVLSRSNISLVSLRTPGKCTMQKLPLNVKKQLCELCWWFWHGVNESARQVLQLNSINPYAFSDTIKNLLARGRGKIRNMTFRPPNYGKTFLLKPLRIIFRAFINPENGKYVWVGAYQADLIVSQDFRWSSELIYSNVSLLFLEGKNVKLTSPKNQCNKDVCINADIHIFVSNKAKIEHVGKHSTHDNKKHMSFTTEYYKKAKKVQHLVPDALRN